MKRLLALILTISLAICMLTGCKNEKVTETDSNMLKTDFSAYKNSSEIPDWDGEQLSIIKWVQATNPNSTCNKSYNLKDDPITKEIKRITGIDYDLDESFDNADASFDAVIAKVIATNTFPHIAEGIPDATSLIKGDYLWDISEYVKEYAPTVYKLFGPDSNTLYADLWNRQMKNYGGVYELAFGTSTEPVKALTNAGLLDISEDRLNGTFGFSTAHPNVAVREDVLKRLYPNSHTNAELKEIYEKNGSFKEEEVFDIPINTPQDFVKLLYDIKELEIKDGSRETYAIFTHTGMDNWPILMQLGAMFGEVSARNPSASYFQYYDKKTGQIKPTFKEKWFKDMLREYNKWIRDGVASEEALVDTNNVFKEKMNNGNYIVSYGSYIPSEAALRPGLSYRTVYAKYTVDTSDTLFVGNDYTVYNRYTFFKEALTEKQLIQVLRMFEFLVSEAGEKLCFWGTTDMGLYTEDEDGNIQYTDDNIKNQMINGSTYGVDKIAEKGLYNMAWPGRIMNQASKYYPRLFYSEELRDWKYAFSSSWHKELETVPGMMPMIYSDAFLGKFEGAKSFWNARNGFEDAMLRIFAAGTDAEFEKKYNEMVKYAEDNGLTDEFYKEATKWYKEEYNKDYMQYVK